MRDERGRFVPGTSGNPGGRPRSPLELRETVRKMLPDMLAALHAIICDESQPAAARVRAMSLLLPYGYDKPAAAQKPPTDQPQFMTDRELFDEWLRLNQERDAELDRREDELNQREIELAQWEGALAAQQQSAAAAADNVPAAEPGAAAASADAAPSDSLSALGGGAGEGSTGAAGGIAGEGGEGRGEVGDTAEQSWHAASRNAGRPPPHPTLSASGGGEGLSQPPSAPQPDFRLFSGRPGSAGPDSALFSGRPRG